MRQFALLLLLLLLAPDARATWSFLGDANLFLGQYYFDRSAGSLNGFTDLNFQQSKSFSPSSGFFISERSIYSGFKQVNELAGGGTLFQQSLDNSIGVKYIHRFEGGYSLKPRIGVRNQLFRETVDEDWTKGLYDFWRYETGITWERKTRLGLSIPWTYQLSYDAYYTNYTHFKSLAAQAAQLGAALGVAPNPGKKTLDTVTNQITYRSDFDLPGFTTLYGMYSLAWVTFVDQNIVNRQGQYLDSKRADTFQTLAMGVSKRLSDFNGIWRWDLGGIRPVPSLGVSVSNLDSNQNNFDTDPTRLKYIGGFFNYWETHFTPGIDLTSLKTQFNLRMVYDLGYRTFSGRLSQEASGAYRSDKLYQLTHSVFIEATYPIWGGLAFKLRGLWADSNANTDFERTYRYNFVSYNYFAGVAWRI